MTDHLISAVLILLFGAAIIVGAFNMKRLIAWEDRTLTRAVDAAKLLREALESEVE